jgi:hypothetical protein
MLDEVARYRLPADYVERRLAELATLEPARLGELARAKIDPARMAIVVVGDAQVVGEALAELGYGEPIRLDASGGPIGER